MVFLHKFGAARVGQAHMAVVGNGFALRVGDVIGAVVFVFHAQRGAAVFFAPENGFLLLQGRAVPKFDKMANQAHGLIAAVFRPSGLIEAVGGNAGPQYFVGGLGVAHIGVAAAVAKAKQVARGGAGLGFGQKAVDAPADNGVLGGVFH